MSKQAHRAAINHDFERGYYRAVAVLLREEGCVTTHVMSLFGQGGDVRHADGEDIELFRAHGLVTKHSGE